MAFEKSYTKDGRIWEKILGKIFGAYFNIYTSECCECKYITKNFKSFFNDRGRWENLKKEIGLGRICLEGAFTDKKMNEENPDEAIFFKYSEFT